MKKNKYTIILILVNLLLIIGCTTDDKTSDISSSIERIYNLDPQRKFIGQYVEDFHLMDIISNKQVHFNELNNDKIIFIQSFSVGCPACVQGIIDYNELYDEYKGKIEVIYMDVNPSDTKEVILDAKEEFNGKDWIWADYQGSLLPFYERFNVNMNDMTFIVDKDGKIVYADSFSVPLSRLKNALEKII